MKNDADPIFAWGIVGTGGIARQFATDLAHVPAARVGAVFSRGGDSVAAFVRGIGDATPCATLEALLEAPGVGAIYIATPNALHAGQALASIRAGKPVLVEKPLAVTVREAEEIAAASSAQGVLAMEAMWIRFLPAVEAARAMIAEGAIGEPLGIHAELAFSRDETTAGRFFDPALGGGAALDLGVYPLSLAVRLFGAPTAIEGSWRRAGSGVDMSSTFRLAFGAVKAEIAASFDRDGANAFTIVGTEGALRLGPPFPRVEKLTRFGPAAATLPFLGAAAGTRGMAARVLSRLPVPGRRTVRHAFPGYGLQFEAKAAMEAIRKGSTGAEAAPIADSIAVLRIIESVLSRPPEPA
jgi:predicted dehydrogenase